MGVRELLLDIVLVAFPNVCMVIVGTRIAHYGHDMPCFACAANTEAYCRFGQLTYGINGIT